MVRVLKHEIKTGMPLDFIILRDKHGRQRILVPKSQRIPLTQTEHETMLHVKGTRILHELSRSYFWPKMAEEIKQFCTACEVVKAPKYNVKTCHLYSDKPPKRTCHYQGKPTALTSTATKKEKSSLPSTYALEKPLCDST
jgi:hypothetical protein